MFEKERPLATTVLAVLLLGSTYFGVALVVFQGGGVRTGARG